MAKKLHLTPGKRAHRHAPSRSHDHDTLLCPQMLPIHFELLKAVFDAHGRTLEIIDVPKRDALDAGLRYANNDLCYPAILVTGQIVAALKSGRYDLARTSVLMVQTGGACRATNYIAVIRKAIADAGLPRVPVVSLSAADLGEKNRFRLTPRMVGQAAAALAIGDVLMKCLYRTRPYEVTPGSADALCDAWIARAGRKMRLITAPQALRIVRDIVRDFDRLPLTGARKPRVGVVGEILVKYHPTANGNLIHQLEAEGCEVSVTGMIEFFSYCISNPIWHSVTLGTSKAKAHASQAALSLVAKARRALNGELAKSKRFEPFSDINDLAELAKPVVSLCNNAGEGWYLVADTRKLITDGVRNVVCIQPFGCLPNHVLGRGTLRELQRRHPEANIMALDFDPGASEANQQNRLKLFLAVAKGC